MRILQVTSARDFGGGERHFVDLTNGLIEKGHEVFVGVTEDSPLIPDLAHIAPANILRLRFRKPLDLASAWKLRKFARANRIDIVHAHMARDYPLAALVAGSSGHPRLVITRHVLFPMRRLHRLTRQRVARVIAVSRAVAVSLRAQGIFRDEQIVLVRHGVDAERFRGMRPRRNSTQFCIGMLGELSPVKGQADFVRAAAILAPQCVDVRFLIAGRDHSADGSYARELKELIAANNLSSRVEVIESRVDIADFLSRLDLLVSASHSEAFGLAIVDGMAAGVPVVATATGGASEIIDDGKTGRLTPIGNFEEMAKCILELLADAEQRERLSAAARDMVAQEFSLERMISETEDVYRAALSG
jgi:glycosyltransferase involved in cell wall biosynthesis